ncbi:MAG: hypothetical protein HY200_03350 [Nitrospirae bacterium]|nr:hypothetical protein [Nitrospirota bacterium]
MKSTRLKWGEKNTTRLKLFSLSLLLAIGTTACSHALHITNLDSYDTPPLVPAADSIRIGVKSQDLVHKDNSRYIVAIVQSLQDQSGGMIKHVTFPFDPSVQEGQVDLLLDISIFPKYSGRKSNFFINWPGFLIWAPAIWGYGYQAEIQTHVNIQDLRTKNTKEMTISTSFSFRESEMDRTWTEIGWLEVSLIPFFSGFYFTQYDPDVTKDFITKVSPTYGFFVTKKIIEAITEVRTYKKPDL